MRVERGAVFVHLPEMRVMDASHAVEVAHRIENRARLDLGRRAEHENADDRADLAEGLPKDVPCYQNGHDRINQSPIVKQDQRARDDHRDRAERVGDIVQEGRANVHTGFGHRVGQHRSRRVHDERNACDDHDQPALDVLRVGEAHRGFVQQVETGHDERRVIDEGGHNLDPAIAEGHFRIPWPPRDLARTKGDDERNRIGEIVKRVCDQGERTGNDATQNLRGRQAEIDRDGGEYPTVTCFGVNVMMVPVSHIGNSFISGPCDG